MASVPSRSAYPCLVALIAAFVVLVWRVLIAVLPFPALFVGLLLFLAIGVLLATALRVGLTAWLRDLLFWIGVFHERFFDFAACMCTS